MTIEIQCLDLDRNSVQTLLRAVLVDGTVRLIGTPEWVNRCGCIRGKTPEDGSDFLRALREEFPDHTSAICYGAPYAA